MSQYLLYREKMINDDLTMRAFATDIMNGVLTHGMKEMEETDYEEEFMKRVHDILVDDISRTDIDYEDLMKKYSSEVGHLLYEIENHGMDLSNIPLSFFGEKAVKTFNFLIENYVWILKFGDGFYPK